MAIQTSLGMDELLLISCLMLLSFSARVIVYQYHSLFLDSVEELNGRVEEGRLH